MATTYRGRKSNPVFTTTFPQEDINAHYFRNNTDSAYNVEYRWLDDDGVKKSGTQSENWVTERLGRYRSTLTPGLNFIVPFLDNVRHKISVLERQLPHLSQDAITRGNVTLVREWYDPAAPDAFIRSSRTRYDPHGNPVLLLDPLAEIPAGGDRPTGGHYREVAFDGRFETYPVEALAHTQKSTVA